MAALSHPLHSAVVAGASATWQTQSRRTGGSAAGGAPGCKTALYGAQVVLPAGAQCGSRVTCKAVYLPPATARTELLEMAERLWLKAHEDFEKESPFLDEELVKMMEKYQYDFQVGQKVRGIVCEVNNAGVLVEIGSKCPAFLPLAESSMYKLKHPSQLGLHEGMEGEFEIIDEEDYDGQMLLSLRKQEYGFAWERARQLLADDVTVVGKVLSTNRGGLMVAVEGLGGFVPMSMVALRTPKEELIGKDIPLKLLEVEEERGRLVLSNRKAMSSSQAQAFAVGSVVLGTVQAVKPYGAFIDLGGVNGLLHISQISHDRITKVETVLNEGDSIKVLILSHDREKGRLSLSTKKLEPTPGDMLRNPALVFEKAEEMANTFRERVAAAEAAARAEELRLQQEGYGGFSGLIGGGALWTGPGGQSEGFGLDLSGL